MVTLILAGCASAEKTSYVQPANQPFHTYALLFDLLGDEKDVSKLLIIKRDRPELAVLIKKISHISADGHKQLAALGKADPNLNLKDLGLPAGEIETRKAIAKTKGKSLLSAKGKDFELRLLLSQSEALTYGAHLAGTIALHETNPARSALIQQLSKDLTDLQKQVFEMILSRY